MTEYVHVSTKLTKFEKPEDRHEVDIPEGHAACVIKSGALPARIDLPPGRHILTGVSFDEYDTPFGIGVMEMKYAVVLAASKRLVPEEITRVN